MLRKILEHPGKHVGAAGEGAAHLRGVAGDLPRVLTADGDLKPHAADVQHAFGGAFAGNQHRGPREVLGEQRLDVVELVLVAVAQVERQGGRRPAFDGILHA